MNRYVAALCALVFAAPMAAQIIAPRPGVSLLAGTTSYDLAGTGSAFAAGAFAEYPVLSFLRVEAGSGFMRYRQQVTGPTTALLFPEIGARLVGAVGGVEPFVGAGAGVALVVKGVGDTEATLHGVAGLRFLATPRLSLRGELRVRSVEPFTGTTADFMGGIALRL